MGYLHFCGDSFTLVSSQDRETPLLYISISHGATPGSDDVTGQGDLAGWSYLYYGALTRAKWRGQEQFTPPPPPDRKCYPGRYRVGRRDRRGALPGRKAGQTGGATGSEGGTDGGRYRVGRRDRRGTLPGRKAGQTGDATGSEGGTDGAALARKTAVRSVGSSRLWCGWDRRLDRKTDTDTVVSGYGAEVGHYGTHGMVGMVFSRMPTAGFTVPYHQRKKVRKTIVRGPPEYEISDVSEFGSQIFLKKLSTLFWVLFVAAGSLMPFCCTHQLIYLG